MTLRKAIYFYVASPLNWMCQLLVSLDRLDTHIISVAVIYFRMPVSASVPLSGNQFTAYEIVRVCDFGDKYRQTNISYRKFILEHI